MGQLNVGTVNADNVVASVDIDTASFSSTSTSSIRGFTFPASDGTNGQFLQTNGSGTLAFADIGSGLPAGSVIYVAQNTAPTNFLKANGADVDRTTYADLFAAIGTTFGAGNGSSTFNVPDLRGYFIRSWDDGRGVDDSRAFGNTQGDAVINHLHRIGVSGRDDQNFTGNGNHVMDSDAGQKGTRRSTKNEGVFATNNSTRVDASETRPKNISLLACIKY